MGKAKQVASLLIFLFLLASSIGFSSQAEAAKICLDAGHGGKDSGAVGCGLLEKTVNLDVAKRIEVLLKAAGHEVFMTRTSDAWVDLLPRSTFCNSKNAAGFASIHCNSHTSLATGIETFAYSTSSKGYPQAQKIQTGMISVWKLANRGVKVQNFSVLRETNAPATLTELAFINNCNVDATYLKSDTHKQSAARQHCLALVAQYGGNAKGCDGVTVPPPEKTGRALGFVVLNSLSPMGEKLAGATYTCNGKSVTTSATAVSSFTLPVGNLKCTASKTGYDSATRTDCEPIRDGADSWCSVAIKKTQVVVPDGKATGYVQDSLAKVNIAAKVSVAGGASTNYTGSGTWSFTLKPGTYKITGEAAGYDSKTVDCSVTSSGTATCNILLNPKKAILKGSVTDASTGKTMAASVTAGGMKSSYSGTGEWSFTVDAGTYTVLAKADGYADGTVNCAAAKGETKVCNIVMEKLQSKRGTIRGSLVDSKTGEKLAGVAVTESQEFTTDRNTPWQFYLMPGTYTVIGKAEGYNNGSVDCTVVSEVSKECDIQLTAKKAVIVGKVYDAITKTNVVANVSLDEQNFSYDGTNNWRFEVEPGSHVVKATADGYHSGTNTCIAQPGVETECLIALASTQAKTGRLVGEVHDVRAEAFLIAASVHIEGFSPIEYSGVGTWEADALPIGTYVVTVYAEGYYDDTATCTVYANNEATFCRIGLKAREGGDTPYTIEKGADPMITIEAVESSCSATMFSKSQSLSLSLLALLLSALAIPALRRRNRRGEI